MEASTLRLSAAVWDLAIPAHRQPGLAMAGFRGRAPSQLALQLVPYPAVTVFIEFGDGVLVDATGARRTGGAAMTATRSWDLEPRCADVGSGSRRAMPSDVPMTTSSPPEPSPAFTGGLLDAP